MKTVPTYGKILSLGSAFTENALVGPVVIQEKVDGSQFGFGINEDGELLMRSKGAPLFEDAYAEMFGNAVDYIVSIKSKLEAFRSIWFYCEYLQKPKHNTLVYERIPKNYLVLFDVVENQKYVDRKRLEELAILVDIDVIPELHVGEATVEKIKELLVTPSFLGKEIIEGVVVKNYTQTILLGGNIFPLFTKYVREAFKERHTVDWKIRQPKDSLQSWMEGFKSEARWQKAILHFREKGLLTQSPKDIGPLLKEIQEDIVIEETENIKNFLYKAFIDDVKRKSIVGFPQWYKDQLLQNVKSGGE